DMQTTAASYAENESLKGKMILDWLSATKSRNFERADDLITNIDRLDAHDHSIRFIAKDQLQAAVPHIPTNDSDYVFITFILDNLPHGLIGLLVASFFLAALGSKASELNALASCSIIDFYRLLI